MQKPKTTLCDRINMDIVFINLKFFYMARVDRDLKDNFAKQQMFYECYEDILSMVNAKKLKTEILTILYVLSLH